MDERTRSWDAWIARMRASDDPRALVRNLPDEAIMDLLAAAGPGDDASLDLLREEAMRRVHGVGERLVHTAASAEARADDVQDLVEQTADVVHATERMVEHLAADAGKEAPTTETKVAHRASAEVERLRDAARKLQDVVQDAEPDDRTR